MHFSVCKIVYPYPPLLSMSNQHITPRKDPSGSIIGWAVVWEWNSRATAILPNQSDAIERGREIAINNQSELFIHWRDNLFRARNSYWNDPELSRW